MSLYLHSRFVVSSHGGDGVTRQIRNSNIECSKQGKLETKQARFRSFAPFGNLNLFRISTFGFRIFPSSPLPVGPRSHSRTVEDLQNPAVAASWKPVTSPMTPVSTTGPSNCRPMDLFDPESFRGCLGYGLGKLAPVSIRGIRVIRGSIQTTCWTPTAITLRQPGFVSAFLFPLSRHSLGDGGSA